MKLGIFRSFLCILAFITVIHPVFADQHVLFRVFNDAERRTAISSFMDSVLKIVSSETFFKKAIRADFEQGDRTSFLRDDVFYLYLLNLRPSLIPLFPLVRKFQILQSQKSMLEKQMRTLLQDRATIGNVLEIGTPGTYGSSLRDVTRGNFSVMTEKAHFTDRLQNISGYDQHVTLNNYDPISSTIPSHSIDLCLCTIGLHHIPQEKLDAFVASIARVVCPGGIFILRDHDVDTETHHDIVVAAHSIFNALFDGVSLETEKNEVRNFQPLSYWIALLEKHGFVVSSERLIQSGDSTKNTMIKAVKQSTSVKELYKEGEQYMKYHEPSQRDVTQTFLTMPEWYNVDSATEYAQFIEHTPFFQFPYVKSINTYWYLFSVSLKAAIKKKGYFNSIFSSYTLMNLFVGTCMTVEYGIKSLISFPVRKMYENEEALSLSVLVHDGHGELQADCFKNCVIKRDFGHGILLIEVPRYKPFTQFIIDIAKTGIKVINIAGNTTIACKISYKQNSKQLLIPYQKVAQWNSITNNAETFCTYEVPVSELATFVSDVAAHSANIVYVHDF